MQGNVKLSCLFEHVTHARNIIIEENVACRFIFI